MVPPSYYGNFKKTPLRDRQSFSLLLTTMKNMMKTAARQIPRAEKTLRPALPSSPERDKHPGINRNKLEKTQRQFVRIFLSRFIIENNSIVFTGDF
jgi:hypothetical protein